jgi:hypothetical protein
VTAPERIVYGRRNTYRLDPYVRDAVGRFAPKPTEPLPPLQVLEAAGDVRTLYDGRVFVAPDGSTTWRVRTIRDDDGSFRVLYLED